MAMRAQFLDYVETVGQASVVGQLPVMRTALGRIQFTKATEFIVIDDVGATPFDTASLTNAFATVVTAGGNETAVQIKINTTEYFLNPDGSQTFGIPGRAAPYPRSNNFYQTFFLDPEVYVLPGQNWEILLFNGATNAVTTFPMPRVFVKYILYDGTDAVIANKLLEMGIAVKPANIDWYKRLLIEQKGGA